jgi:hypothetical protein
MLSCRRTLKALPRPPLSSLLLPASLLQPLVLVPLLAPLLLWLEDRLKALSQRRKLVLMAAAK